MGEETLRALASNCGFAYLRGARATGKRWQVDEDLVMSGLGLPVALPPNNACVIGPRPDVETGEDIARRVHDFFQAGPGGGYQLWSIWPDLDLAKFGFSPEPVPCMIRPPGGERRPGPPELAIYEVTDEARMIEAWSVIDPVFCEGRAPEPLWDARVLSRDYRVWVGLVHDNPVATATAFVSDGFVGVYASCDTGRSSGSWIRRGGNVVGHAL